MVTNRSDAPVYIGRFRILPGDGLPGLPLTAEEEADVERLVRKGLLARSAAPAPGDSAEAKAASKSESKPDKGKDKTAEKHGADA